MFAVTARNQLAGAGTQNAGLAFGGGAPPSVPVVSCTEEYNGTSWTAGGALITARYTLAGAGTQNAGLAFGGRNSVSTTVSCTEEYGSSVVNTRTFEYSCTTGGLSLTGTTILSGNTTMGGNLNVSGTTTMGGNLNVSGTTTIGGNLNVSGTTTSTNFVGNGSGLTGVSAFPFSGSAAIAGNLAVTANTGNIQFLYPTVGANAWSAGGALITARTLLAGAGTQNAGLAIGGFLTPIVRACTEEYDGISWAAGGALITARSGLGAAGTQNAGLAFGGGAPTIVTCTEEYNGTSWSAGGALSVARYGLAGAGTQNEGLAFGGNAPLGACTEEYNGATWSTGGALINARRNPGGAGTQNVGLAFGGVLSPAVLTSSEEYNGSAWSAGGALITARYQLAGAGTQNDALAFGGYLSPSNRTCTELYNGTSWTAVGALITGRSGLGGAGTTTAGLAFGGFVSGSVSCTEEFGPSIVSTKTFEYSCSTGVLNLTGDTTINGNLNVSGCTTTLCLIETSAQRYKENIVPMESQLSKVLQLQPVEFDWISDKKHDIGFIADYVENVYPNLVAKNADGEIEGMNYTKLVSVIVKGMQEQQEQINSLYDEINKLKNK